MRLLGLLLGLHDLVQGLLGLLLVVCGWVLGYLCLVRRNLSVVSFFGGLGALAVRLRGAFLLCTGSSREACSRGVGPPPILVHWVVFCTVAAAGFVGLVAERKTLRALRFSTLC